jgi:hypothetical protein
VLHTASLDPALDGLVDLWVPNLNCLFVKARPDEYCEWRAPREAYRAPARRGAGLWFYVSCSSHGCVDGPRPSYFRGWPGYAIDLPGGRARGLAWIAEREGFDGELYWDTVHGYAPGGLSAPRPSEPRPDPWDGPRAFGVAGDGTLFYPGLPPRVGGTTGVPIESLRLKLIREGQEDRELLRLVAALPGGAALATREEARIAPSPWEITADAGAFEAARGRLLDFLAASLESGAGDDRPSRPESPSSTEAP